MEVAKELKRLTNDAYTIGLYDEEEERRIIENTKLNTAKKQGIKQGAKEREKSIAKTMLKAGESVSKVMSYTGLNKKDIKLLM